MGPVVAVDLPNAPSELRARALDGCNAALRAGRCVALGQAPGADCFAVIRWETDEHRLLVVTFRRRETPPERAEVRHLSFAARDDAATRWAAAGLVVASLVGEHSKRGAPEGATESPATPTPTHPPLLTQEQAGPSNAAHSPALAISTLGSVGFAPRARTRGGLELLLTGHLAGWPLFGAAAARYGLAPGTADLRTIDVGLGLGVRFGGWRTRWSSELRGDFVWEHLTAVGTPSGSAEESATRTRLGARATATVLLAASRHWSALAGADLTLLKPDVLVQLDGKEAAFDPSWRYGVLIGVRFSP